MERGFDNWKRFIEDLGNIGFWERLFGWGRVRRQLAQAIADLNVAGREADHLDKELARAEVHVEHLQRENARLAVENAQLIKDDTFRRNEHSGALASLREIREQVRTERAGEVAETNAREMERMRALRDAWSRHEEQVRGAVKAICQRYTIEYVDKVPFKGSPDNTLKICDEYIVFDAKSPGAEDLKHFPAYLKVQAETAVKYTRQEGVRSDIFFVVPASALSVLNTFTYRHGDHNVYVIGVDALEPVIVCLKKMEEYEFAEQLSPEDRENICRMLGRFAHLSKRRIQVDSFFARQFIALAYKCETDLPEDLLKDMLEFEKSEKLNPPQEKRAKAIPVTELEQENNRIVQEAAVLFRQDIVDGKLDDR